MADAVIIQFPGYPFQNLTSAATIAALRAISSASLSGGQDMAVDAGTTIGDGLGGVFSWSASSTATDDGVSIIKPTDKTPMQAGRWIAAGNQTKTKRPEAPAVMRLLTSRNDESVYAKDYSGDDGSVGQYAYDFTQNFKDMVQYAPAGAVLDFSHGISAADFADFRITDAVTITKHLSLRGRNSRIVGDMADTNTDLIRYVPGSEIRNVSIEGLRLGFNAGGRHALWMGNGSVGILSSRIQTCNINSGLGGDAIHFEGIGTHFNQVLGCSLTGTNAAGAGIYLGGADGTVVQGNVLQGIGHGVRCALVNGAFKTRIISNGITTRDMGVYVTSGQQIDIIGNQFEQGTGNPTTQENQATYKGHIVLIGSGTAAIPTPTGEEVRDIIIKENSFGAGSNQDCPIYLVANTRDVFIDENEFNNVADTGFDITLYAATAKYTYVGMKNRVGGLRSLAARGTANTLDPKTLLAISDTGTGTYGYAARKGFSALTSPGAGWTGATFKFWKDANDQLHFEGTLAVDATAGSATAGFAIGTLPIGFRPSETLYPTIGNNSSSTASRLSIDTAGVIKVDAGVSLSSTIFMNSAGSLPIKGHADFLSGPF